MKNKFLRFISFGLICLTLCLGLMIHSAKANPVVVNTFAELKAAVDNAGTTEITLGSDIVVEDSLSIPAGRTLKVNGDNHTLSLNAVNDQGMFVITGGTVTFDNTNFDGNTKGRALRISESSTVTINGGRFSNGVSWTNGASSDHANSDGGAIYATGDSNLTITGSTFTNNLGVTPNPQPREAMNGHGGAIYAFKLNSLTIENSTFENNVSGVTSGGGAVYVESTKQFNATGNTFTGNHTDAIDTRTNQGGAMYVHSTNYVGERNTYNIARTFNTGGAIFFQSVVNGKTAVERNSTFTIGALGDGFGISGGAISVSTSDVTIENSTFTSTDGGTKVTHAGGFIAVAPTIVESRLTVKDSTFTGNGSWWNGPSAATYGGAIAFETDEGMGTTNVVALIENSTFKNIAADQNGGAITVSTKKGHTGNVQLTVRNSTIQNTRAKFAWAPNFVGGGIYVGPGNTLTVEGGRFTESFANRGGSIYNDGTTTITGGATIINNTAYQTGGGIYNNGVLTIDEATLSNNRNAEGRNYPDKRDPEEFVGGNVYAKKDVTITPNATFDDYDVRILDKESAILLTGSLTKKINVSISEKAGGNGEYAETQHRYVGYTVAKGREGYTPVATDAQFIHYVTKDTTQAVSEYEDHTSTAKWDYVFNPETKTVVLGQRAKLVYHTNHKNAVIKNGLADTEPTGQKYEQVYTFYQSGNGEPKVSVNDTTVTELTTITDIPVLEANGDESLIGYVFKSWNTDVAKEKPRFDIDRTEAKYSFNSLTFTNTWHHPTTEEIITILSPEHSNTLHTYAVYDKLLVVKAKKVWNAINKTDVTLQLIRTDKNNEVVQELVVAPDQTDWSVFTPQPMVENGVNIKDRYAVVEKGAANGKITLNNNQYNVSVTEDKTLPNQDNTRYFVVTNSDFKTIQVTKQWSAKDKLAEVKAGIYDGDTLVETLTLNETNQWTAVSSELPTHKTVNDQAEAINYTVYELDGDDNPLKPNGQPPVLISDNKTYLVRSEDVTATTANPVSNRQYFDLVNQQVQKVSVEKVWNGEEQAELGIELYYVQNGQDVSVSKFTLGTTSGWKTSFSKLKVLDSDGNPIAYKVRELDAEGNPVTDKVTLNGKDYHVVVADITDSIEHKEVATQYFRITNSQYKTIQITKQWSAKDKLAEVKAGIYDGDTLVETLTLNETNQWTAVSSELPTHKTVNDQAEAINYTVYELDLNNQALKANGSEMPSFVSNDFVYKVQVEDVTASKQDAVANRQYFEVTNKQVQNIVIKKVWVGDVPSQATVQLYYVQDNNEQVVENIVLTETDGWEASKLELPLVDQNGNPITYQVRELDAEGNPVNKVVTLDNHDYYVVVEETTDKITDKEIATRYFQITNIQQTPQLPLTPGSKKIIVHKQWFGALREKEIEVQLYKLVNGKEELIQGKVLKLNATNNWTATFTDLPSVEAIGDAKGIVYVVKEVGEKDKVVQFGNNKYSVQVMENENHVTIVNTYINPPVVEQPKPKTLPNAGFAHYDVAAVSLLSLAYVLAKKYRNK